jgi:hypothetical protein
MSSRRYKKLPAKRKNPLNFFLSFVLSFHCLFAHVSWNDVLFFAFYKLLSLSVSIFLFAAFTLRELTSTRGWREMTVCMKIKNKHALHTHSLLRSAVLLLLLLGSLFSAVSGMKYSFTNWRWLERESFVWERYDGNEWESARVVSARVISWNVRWNWRLIILLWLKSKKKWNKKDLNTPFR